MGGGGLSAAAYVQFEDAFPLADAWLTVCLVVAAAACLRGHARRARVWLLAAASSGLNALTLMLSVLLWWLSSRAATASDDRVTEM